MTPTGDSIQDAVDDAISAARERPFRSIHRRPVGGGCINRAVAVDDGDEAYFVKINDAARLEMFVAEAAGLEALGATGTIKVPRPVCHGQTSTESFLVLEYLDLRSTTTAIDERCGSELAALHRHGAGDFGWHRDNTIGASHQDNRRHTDWIEFWRQRRLGAQLELAQRNDIDRTTFDRGQQLMSELDLLFADYTPVSSLE